VRQIQGIKAGANKFCRNLGSNSKFEVPEKRDETSSKFICHGNLAPGIFVPLD